MKYRVLCVARPDRCPERARFEIERLDRDLFESDQKAEIEGCWWWVIYDSRNRPVAVAGMRACKAKGNIGLAYLTRSGVLTEHRGRGLQKRLIRARVAMAKRNRFKEVVTYTLNWNLASANSLASCGFNLYRPSEDWAGKYAHYFRLPISFRNKRRSALAGRRLRKGGK